MSATADVFAPDLRALPLDEWPGASDADRRRHPARRDDRRLRRLAVGIMIHGGRSTQVWDVTVARESDARVLAHFRCTQHLLGDGR